MPVWMTAPAGRPPGRERRSASRAVRATGSVTPGRAVTSTRMSHRPASAAARGEAPRRHLLRHGIAEDLRGNGGGHVRNPVDDEHVDNGKVPHRRGQGALQGDEQALRPAVGEALAGVNFQPHDGGDSSRKVLPCQRTSRLSPTGPGLPAALSAGAVHPVKRRLRRHMSSWGASLSEVAAQRRDELPQVHPAPRGDDAQDLALQPLHAVQASGLRSLRHPVAHEQQLVAAIECRAPRLELVVGHVADRVVGLVEELRHGAPRR